MYTEERVGYFILGGVVFVIFAIGFILGWVLS